MTREVKCQYCGEYDSKDNMTYIETGKTKKQKKYYHEECLEVKERDSQEYADLLDYICNLFNIEVPNGMILKQIKEFKQGYKYRYYAMQLALHYFFVIKENNIPEHKTIGIVPFVMEDAKNYYQRVSSISEEEHQIKSVSTIIKEPKRTNSMKKTINISEL